MDKKYLKKIIAKDTQGLQLISACCSEAKVKIEDIKFLENNKKVEKKEVNSNHHKKVYKLKSSEEHHTFMECWI